MRTTVQGLALCGSLAVALGMATGCSGVATPEEEPPVSRDPTDRDASATPSPDGAPRPTSDAAALDASGSDAETSVDADAPDVVGPAPNFDSRLYLLPKKEFKIGQLEAAVDAALAAHPGVDNLVLFVHGRSCGGGGEPTKSLDSVVPDMEKQYTSAVVMFFWPGSDAGCPVGFPDSEARAAGPALRYALGALQAYARKNAAKLAGVKLTLLTHSMGNLVLESALGKATGLAPSLFASVILNSSATALAGHAAWLSRLDFATSVYVTVNGGDKVLLAAGTGRGTRLGRDLGTERLTSRASYVDFSAAGVNHQYYVASGQKGAHMPAFYQAVMNGRPYDFAGSGAIDRTTTRDGATVYVFDGK